MDAFDYAALQALYDDRVDAAGTVDYAGLCRERAALERVTDAFAEARPDDFATDLERFAFWINGYNITCIRGVVDHYPTPSVRKIAPLYGFFWRLRFRLAGRPLTLSHVENRILRGRFRDPRLHFAIVCASGSCPRLSERVYRPETLDAQLEAATREFLATPAKNAIDPVAGVLRLSRIFRWYRGDFSREAGSVRAYVARHVSPLPAAFVRSSAPLRYLPYDWALNDRAGVG